MNTLKLIAYCALLTGASASFGHTSKDSAHAAPVLREQKDWGIAGDAKAVKRTITLTMTDTMRFTPDTLSVKQGETIKFVVKNSGALQHEMVIGTAKELADHAALMVKFPTMEHSEPYMVHVAPRTSGQMVWTFNRAGSFDFACLMAGHFQAGMVGKITVTPQ
jgi:uncharacterized cupredoxin-like copper-binding protein